MESDGSLLQIVAASAGIGCIFAVFGFAAVYGFRFLAAVLHFLVWIASAGKELLLRLLTSIRRYEIRATTTKKQTNPKKKLASKSKAKPAIVPSKPKAQPEKLAAENPVPKPAADQPSLKKMLAQMKNKPTSTDKSVQRHKLELNALKGHANAINGIAFNSSGSAVASACADGYVRVFKLENASSKNQQFLRLKVPPGGTPSSVAFGDGDENVVVVSQDIMGANLIMFGPAEGKAAKVEGKLVHPEEKWSLERIHELRSVLTCMSARGNSTGGSGTLVVTCSEGTDIKLWTTKGDCVATVDTNQLRNSMAAISPCGRFFLAAAFTGDVKIWEIRYGKDGQVHDVSKVMMLKGHKSAVIWACFTWDSQRVITASKDGTLRIWNINVRYHMDEDPKCLRVFSIESAQFEKIAVSPDAKVLAVTHSTTLKWLSTETGDVLDTARNAHDDAITGLCWAPQPLNTDHGKVPVLATCSLDKKLKLWLSP